jgi:hypothetical protein
MHRTHRLRALFSLILTVCVGLNISPRANAQNSEDLLDQLMKDLFKVRSSGTRMSIVIWLPEEFWRLVMNKYMSETEPTATAESRAAVDSLVKQIGAYNIVAVADGRGDPGATVYLSEPTIRSSIQFIDATGNSSGPVNASDVSPEVRAVVGQMRQTLGKMLGSKIGQMGEGVHLFAFPGRTPNGARIAPPDKPGSVTIRYSGVEVSWRLPLGSIASPKKCPLDGELLNGGWTYCPWHGAKLEDQKPADKKQP